jgi:anti-sigma factor RsiW
MNNQQHCKDLLSTISDYVDGSLSDQLCADLEKHLIECENCQIVVNTLKKTIEIYHEQGSSETTPPEVKDRLFLRLNLSDYLKK